jgi:hypothetical protein
MNNPLELSLSQSFEKERFLRVIEESNDIKQLKEISKVLLNGWFVQKAAAQWIMREALNSQKNQSTVQPNGHQHT